MVNKTDKMLLREYFLIVTIVATVTLTLLTILDLLGVM